MPFPKHTEQTVKVSPVLVPCGVANELELVANAILCNLMRQMISISQLDTNMFEELTTERSSSAGKKTMQLQNRLEPLQQDVQNMQKGDEDLTVNLQPVKLPQFISKKPADSQMLSRNTVPPINAGVLRTRSPSTTVATNGQTT
ncbi:hypothetical protein D915_005668 [Fasciola hepatica]|uniref:Uncharacterized protein n=1 Tax=Fasciola hepatica TaxID=6192 RepID=A0A4E0RAN0_FASHE|nr:hypothetical protein D915_005668 [Fasciola hepatica]